MISDDEAVRVYCAARNALPGVYVEYEARATLAMLRALGVLPAEDAPVSSPIFVREAARRRQPLDGADAQALEGALSLTERERDGAQRGLAALHDQLAAAREDADAALQQQRVQIACDADLLMRLARERDELIAALTRVQGKLDEAREMAARQLSYLQRIRDVLIEQIGTHGTELAVETAERAAGVIADLRAARDQLAALRGENATHERDKAREEAKRWQGSGVYAAALGALLAQQREGESIVDVVPRLLRERIEARARADELDRDLTDLTARAERACAAAHRERDEARAERDGSRATREHVLGQLREAREAQARAEQSAAHAQEQAASALGTTPEGLAVVREVLAHIGQRGTWGMTAALKDLRARWIAAGRPLGGDT